MSNCTTTWRVPLWAWPYLCAALVAESVSNALKAYGLGTHLDQFTLSIAGYHVSIAGSVLVLAAIAVSGSQARAAWVALTPTSPARQRIVAGLAAVLLLAVSVSAMTSHLLEAQRAKVADEGGERGRHDRAKAAYDKLKGEDDALQVPAPPRSVTEIQADVAGVKIDMRIWRASKQCDDITREESKAACAPVLALYKERARAARRTELAPDLANAKAALDAAPRPEEATAAETSAAGVWGWLMGFAVVFVATFGSVIFARVDQLTAVTRDQEQPKFGGLDFPNRPGKPNGSSSPAPCRRSRRPRGGRSQPNRSKKPGPNSSESRRFPRNEVLANLQRQLANGDRFDSQDRMSERFGVPKSTLSEWLAHWESLGLIPARRQIGRRKVLANV